MAIRIPISTTGGDQATAELKRVGDEGQRALDRINNASRQPATGLKALNAAAGELRGGMQDLAGRAGPIGQVIAGLGPAGLAAAAGLAAMSLGFSAAAREAEEAFRQNAKIEAVLRATASASGQTAVSIDRLSQSISQSTLATADNVKEAATVLLTFKAVSGDAFGRTLIVAQDLAAVMGTDLKSAVMQLGKALEAPETQLSQLRRSGISFNDAQIEMIKTMVEAGQQAEAMSEILGVIEGQVSGAGAAEAGGLTGSVHRLAETWEQFLESLGNTTPLIAAIEYLTNLAGAAQFFLAPDDAMRRDQAEQDLFEEKKRLRMQLDSQTAFGYTVNTSTSQATMDRIAALQAEIKALDDAAAAEARRTEEARKAGEAAQDQASNEARRKQLIEEEQKLLDQQAKEQAKAAEASKRAAEQVARQRQGAREAIDAQIDALQNEQHALNLTERERAIFNELLKAEAIARRGGIQLTKDQIDAIRAETGALHDRNEAIRAQKDAEEEAKRAAEKAAEERKRAAEREAEAMQKPFEHAAENIQDAFTDAFENIFSGNVDSFKDFADQVKRIFIKLAAEIATLMVFSPQVNAVSLSGGGVPVGSSGVGLGGIGGAGGGGGFGGSLMNLFSGANSAYKFFTSGDVLGSVGGFLTNNGRGFGSILGDFSPANLGANMLSGFAGNYVGSVLSDAFGLNGGYGNVGGTIGAAIGAIWGLPGAFIGGTLGNLIGNSFGGNEDPKAVLSVQQHPGAGAFEDNYFVKGPFGSYGFDNTISGGMSAAKETGNLIPALVQVEQLMYDLMTDAERQRNMRPFVGNVRANQWEELEKPAPLLQERWGFLLGNVDAQLKAAFDRFASVGRSVEDLGTAAVELLALKRAIDDTVEAVKPAQQAINAINAQFDEAAAKARQYGYGVAQIEVARQRALAQLTADFNEGTRLSILAITDPMAAALEQFDKAAQERLANARILGADLIQLERLTALERKAIIEQYSGAANDAIYDSIQSLLDSLKSGSVSPLSADVVLANAQARFDALSAAALGGDGEAIGALSGAATDLLDASRAIYASSGMFFSRFDSVVGTLERVVGNAPGFAHGGEFTVGGSGGIDSRFVAFRATPGETVSVRRPGDTVNTLNAIGSEIARGNAALIGALRTEIGELRATVDRQQSLLERMVNAPRRAVA